MNKSIYFYTYKIRTYIERNPELCTLKHINYSIVTAFVPLLRTIFFSDLFLLLKFFRIFAGNN